MSNFYERLDDILDDARAGQKHNDTIYALDALYAEYHKDLVAERDRFRDEADKLREEIKDCVGEYTGLRDRHQGFLVEQREHGEKVREAALAEARRRTLDLAVHALANLRGPLRSLANQLVEAEGYSRLGNRAHELLRELDRKPAPDSTEQVVADMKAARDRLIAEKTAMWNLLSRHGLLDQLGEAAS